MAVLKTQGGYFKGEEGTGGFAAWAWTPHLDGWIHERSGSREQVERDPTHSRADSVRVNHSHCLPGSPPLSTDGCRPITK